MNTFEFAEQIEKIVESLKSRILNTGADQYDLGDVQKIELKSPAQIISETCEEVDDAIVYLSHLRSRLNKIKELHGYRLDLVDSTVPYVWLNMHLSDSIAQIRDLHKKVEGPFDDYVCSECTRISGEEVIDAPYPCPTIKALDGAKK